jgi:anti-sigma-K factor RskA
MKSYLQHLENNEAILLMYMAGELPEADRQEVEQMLASDATLRAELDILRRTHDLAFDALASLDELTRPVLTPAETQNRMTRLISGWLAQRREAAVRALADRGPMPWRRISFAAAAMLLVGYYVWAVYDRLDRPITKPPIAEEVDDGIPHSPAPRTLSDNEKVALLSNSLEDSNSDESDLHLAEVAAVVPSDGDNSGTGQGTDSNTVVAP